MKSKSTLKTISLKKRSSKKRTIDPEEMTEKMKETEENPEEKMMTSLEEMAIRNLKIEDLRGISEMKKKKKEARDPEPTGLKSVKLNQEMMN